MEIGTPSLKRFSKSSRSSIRATVYDDVNLMTSGNVSGSSQSLLYSMRTRLMSRMRPTCSTYVRAFSAISSGESGGRVSLRPVGSPMRAVAEPTTKMTSCPSSWNDRSFRIDTAWPICRSGRVGSKPCFTRSGSPLCALRSSFFTRCSSGMISTVWRRISSICSLTDANFGIKAKLRRRRIFMQLGDLSSSLPVGCNVWQFFNRERKHMNTNCMLPGAVLSMVLWVAPLQAQANAGVSFVARRSEMIIEMPAADLPANLAYNDKGVVVSREALIPADLWIHGYSVDIVDAAGVPMQVSLLHHISVYAPDRRELFTPIMQRIAAAGSETGKVRIPNW